MTRRGLFCLIGSVFMSQKKTIGEVSRWRAPYMDETHRWTLPRWKPGRDCCCDGKDGIDGWPGGMYITRRQAEDFRQSLQASFAGVKRTVDATEPEMVAIAQGFRELAKTIPYEIAGGIVRQCKPK